jgi:hypothetical protein
MQTKEEDTLIFGLSPEYLNSPEYMPGIRTVKALDLDDN